MNPADLASRGLSAVELSKSGLWYNGPAFLHKPGAIPDISSTAVDNVPDQSTGSSMAEMSKDDPEVRCSLNTKIVVDSRPGLESTRFNRISSFTKLLRVVAYCIRYVRILRSKVSGSSVDQTSLSVAELENAECVIVRTVQKECFSDQYVILSQGVALSSHDVLAKLCCYVDQNNVLRVGGRLQHADIDEREKHPYVLPKLSHVSKIMVLEAHKSVEHQGKGMTMSAVRQMGYWVVALSSLVASLIYHCVKCRKLRGKSPEPIMADLPEDRVAATAPFTYVAVDFFGPFVVKEGRNALKRWGVIFVCMSSRAVHVETANELSTDSFINCLRRFKSIRGPIRWLRCDKGTNFVGMVSELKRCMKEIKDDVVREYLLSVGCDLEVKFNVPTASHMAGSWERLIQNVKRVLHSILIAHHDIVNDEMLRTFLCEAAAIVNSRPLSSSTLGDVNSLHPLTPNDLITMKTKPLLPPPGNFVRNDLYCRKRWRKLQYLVNLFWKRFRQEYLQILQARSKWYRPRNNVQCGDVVMLRSEDNIVRNVWTLGRVVQVYASSDACVRSCKVQVASSALNDKGQRQNTPLMLDRPVHKLVVLLPNEE